MHQFIAEIKKIDRVDSEGEWNDFVWLQHEESWKKYRESHKQQFYGREVEGSDCVQTVHYKN